MDVLDKIDLLRQISWNSQMPKKWHAGFWRAMDEAHAEIVSLRRINRVLRRINHDTDTTR